MDGQELEKSVDKSDYLFVLAESRGFKVVDV